jgi:hypothetical protein
MDDFGDTPGSKAIILDSEAKEHKNDRAVLRCTEQQHARFGIVLMLCDLSTASHHGQAQALIYSNQWSGRFPASSLAPQLTHALFLNSCCPIQHFCASSALGGCDRVHCCRFCDHIKICRNTSWSHPWIVSDFQARTRQTLTQDMLCAADQCNLEKITGLCSSPVTVQMDAGTIISHGFWIVSCSCWTPLLFHAEFYAIFW